MSENRLTPFDADTPLDQTVTFRMVKLSQRYSAQAAQVLRGKSQLSLSEWRVLMMLATYGSLSPADISRRLMSDDSLISRTVKSLLSKGLAVSAPDPQDRRASILSMTADGEHAYAQIRPYMYRRREAVVGALSAEDQGQLRELLGKLEAMMDKMDEDLWKYVDD